MLNVCSNLVGTTPACMFMPAVEPGP